MPPDSKLAWAKLKFPASRKPYPAVRRFVDALRELHVNGTASHCTFRFPRASAFLTTVSRGELLSSGFFDQFWQLDSVRRAMPELAAPPGFKCQTPFRLGNPFTLAGEFASALYSGGAYGLYKGTTADAKAEVADAAEELLWEQFERVQVYTNHAAWCDVFDGIVDWTWVIVDTRSLLVHVLYATDVD